MGKQNFSNYCRCVKLNYFFYCSSFVFFSCGIFSLFDYAGRSSESYLGPEQNGRYAQLPSMATVRSSRALRTPPRITGILLTYVIRSLKGNALFCQTSPRPSGPIGGNRTEYRPVFTGISFRRRNPILPGCASVCCPTGGNRTEYRPVWL